MGFEVVAPIISTVITGIFLVIVAKINRDNKPVKDVLKRTKIEGNGSLVEALGILQKEYKDSQERHATEIQYYVEQVSSLRSDLRDVKEELSLKDQEIQRLRAKLEEHENRLNSGHVGEGR